MSAFWEVFYVFTNGHNGNASDIYTWMTSITNKRPSIPTFSPGTPTRSAGPLKSLRINCRPLTAVVLARSLVSGGNRNLCHILAATDCAFDMAEQGKGLSSPHTGISNKHQQNAVYGHVLGNYRK